MTLDSPPWGPPSQVTPTAPQAVPSTHTPGPSGAPRAAGHPTRRARICAPAAAPRPSPAARARTPQCASEPDTRAGTTLSGLRTRQEKCCRTHAALTHRTTPVGFSLVTKTWSFKDTPARNRGFDEWPSSTRKRPGGLTCKKPPSPTGGTARPRTPPSTIYSRGPGVRRGPGGAGGGGHHIRPISCPFSPCSGPQPASSQHLPSDAPSSAPIRPVTRAFCPSTGLQGPGPACVPKYLRGPQKDKRAAGAGQPADTERAHYSLQAQVQDGTQAQVKGTCVPTSLLTSKLTLLKQTQEKPLLCTQVELRGESRTTHLHRPSLRKCSGGCGLPTPPPPPPPFPTSHPPHHAPTNPCPSPGLFDPSSAEESTS